MASGEVKMKNTDKFLILGRMSAMLAHEIRNPLAGISAVTQVLEGKIDRNDPRKKYVSLIMKEIDRVNKIVHELLDYTRDSRPYFVRVEVASLVDKALAFGAEELEEKNIQVDRQYESEGLVVQVDQEMIQRVFSNIIENAIEALDENGRLTITAEADEHDNGKRKTVRIGFSDTGRGTELDDLSEMFSPFYTTKTKGTGLGLAVSSKVVEEHNGTLGVEANPEKGLTFTVTLPADQLDQESSSGNRQQGMKDV
jgi:signal transduction histidine kinase